MMATQKTRFKFALVRVDTGNVVSESRYCPKRLERDRIKANSFVGREKYVLKRIAAWQNNEVVCHESNV